MSFQIIRPQIKTLLESISLFQEVGNAPTLKFNGFPACYVVPSDNSADYETTSENVRVYAFVVRAFYETKDTGVRTALTAMEELIDKILDTFDKEDFKTNTTRTIGINLPTGYTFLNIFAHPSAFGELPEENLIMSEIIVKIRVSIDVNST